MKYEDVLDLVIQQHIYVYLNYKLVPLTLYDCHKGDPIRIWKWTKDTFFLTLSNHIRDRDMKNIMCSRL
jgi:hypothetical protein